MTPRALIGVIGGSGLYRIAGARGPGRTRGADAVRRSVRRVRHRRARGRPRRLPRAPRARASPHADRDELPREHLRLQGCSACETIVSASAVGSLREDVRADGHRLSRPVHRSDPPSARHVLRRTASSRTSPSRDPVCEETRAALAEASRRVGAVTHDRGAYVCMEGPQFSTRAESMLYRSWGADVIGMTNLQEAKLAREAEICYATMALVTDYDCLARDGSGRLGRDHRGVSPPERRDRLRRSSARRSPGSRPEPGPANARPRSATRS